jgi:hypothetical protein
MRVRRGPLVRRGRADTRHTGQVELHVTSGKCHGPNVYKHVPGSWLPAWAFYLTQVGADRWR